MLQALKSTDFYTEDKKSITTNPYYQKAKKRYNSSRKQMYKEMKKKNDKRR